MIPIVSPDELQKEKKYFIEEPKMEYFRGRRTSSRLFIPGLNPGNPLDSVGGYYTFFANTYL